jgi:dephospho-CoA kinase
LIFDEGSLAKSGTNEAGFASDDKASSGGSVRFQLLFSTVAFPCAETACTGSPTGVIRCIATISILAAMNRKHEMIILGLTGSIGMGKSTVAQMFRDLGVAVHDADAVVHALYEGEAVHLVDSLFPGTASGGKVDRARLAARILDDPAAMRKLEDAIHPLVRNSEKAFLKKARQRNDSFVVLDIPLLFETGADRRVDGVIVVTADPGEQRRRVLGRPGMSEAKFNSILARQMADSEKRRRADFLITTGSTRNSESTMSLEATRRQVIQIADRITSGSWKPVAKPGLGD